MPGLDHELDPDTGDWVPDGRGGFKMTANNTPAVMHALRDHRGWPGDPNAGGSLQDLTAMLSTEAVVEAQDRIRTALQPLLDDGLIRDVNVLTQRDVDRVFVAVEIVDNAGGTHDITNLTPFGE